VSKQLAWSLCLLALCVSCQKFAEGRQVFHDLLALRDQIAAEFHEQVGNVSISKGGRMTVSFINSPLNAHSSEEKQKRADEVAAFVTRHYKQPLKAVTTVFASQKGGMGVTMTQSESFAGHLPQNP
jgi:hypothetical protein